MLILAKQAETGNIYRLLFAEASEKLFIGNLSGKGDK